jgi:hypothetical protein
MTTRTISPLATEASRQLMRISHWAHFPKSQAAVQDYIGALAKMDSPEAIRQLMDDIVAGEWSDFPSVAAINAMVYDRMSARRSRTLRCKLCGGHGVRIQYRLVTYEGQSFAVKRTEVLEQVENDKEADEFMNRLHAQMKANPHADRRAVLTFAVDCACRQMS